MLNFAIMEETMLSHKDFDFKSVLFVFTEQDHLRFANENLVLEDKASGKIKNQMPCIKIFCVFVIGGMTITNYLLEKSSQYGFTLIFMKFNFKPYAFLGSQTEGNTLLRQKQYQTLNNEKLAEYIVASKINNQLQNLKLLRNKNDVVENAIHRLSEILPTIENPLNTQETNSHLLGKEGNAGKIYFQAYFQECQWQARRPRAKNDPLNTLMDIGYTFLFNFIESHLRLYGFDVYAGFYHRLFYQRKSLVCDMVEPFRCIVDKGIRKKFNLKQFKHEDFKKINHQYYLKKNKSKIYTQALFQDILEYKRDIFFFVRDYYRSFVRDKPIAEYPVFSIAGKEEHNANR